MPEFVGFPKIARYSRKMFVTEKLDGTNIQIFIDGNNIYAGSRHGWITLEKDHHGFAKWMEQNKEELLKLGPGRHFGEWWGCGINRGYNLKEKRFSMFNISRWCLYGETPKEIPTEDPNIFRVQKVLPKCCGLVPLLYEGEFDTDEIKRCLVELQVYGSRAVPGYMNSEGVIIYHAAGNVFFKKTINNDIRHKSQFTNRKER